MTTYRTGNAIGSADPRDLYDNAENLDELVNSRDKAEHPDRLGVPRKTWHGMEEDFQAFLLASGYQDLGVYAPGIEITARNQYVTFGGQPYLLKPSIPVPYTTSGEWTGDDFKLIGDDALRQDLANPDKGAAMVALDRTKTSPAGTVGEALSVRVITNTELFPHLTDAGSSGIYRVSGLTDGPGFNGFASVSLSEVAGGLYGYCEITSYGGPPPRRAISRCSNGSWSEWREVAFSDELSFSSLTGQGGMSNLSGVPVSTDQIIPIAKGSYSWWNEPQSIQLGVASQKAVIGVVPPNGALGIVQVKPSSNVNLTERANLPTPDRYVTDEHNGPVLIEAGEGIVALYPGHNDRTYIPYFVGASLDVSSLGKERRIEPGVGNVSYAQAWYTDTIPTQLPRVWVMFRAGSGSGANRTWYISWSENWAEITPTWTTHPIVTDTDQMYVRVQFNPSSSAPNIVRFLGTKNASYDTTNGLWFGYMDLRAGEIKTAGGTVVGSFGDTPVSLTADLTLIYSAPRRIRLYDIQGHSSGLPILFQTFAGGSGGQYKYAYYDVSDWTLKGEVDIVFSGVDMGTGTYYFGGAHFSNISEGSNVSPGPVYIARNDSGEWLLEEWTTPDSGVSWVNARTLDSSSTEKIWRPRVPFNTRQRWQGQQLVLTYCKGTWTTYRDFDSTVYGMLRTQKVLR